jgi:hypothetical protein
VGARTEVWVQGLKYFSPCINVGQESARIRDNSFESFEGIKRKISNGNGSSIGHL